MSKGLLILNLSLLPRIMGWIGVAFYSLLLLIISVYLGLSSYKPNIAGVISERGYFTAINWSIGYTFFVPFLVYYGLGAFKTANKIGKYLQDRGMFVDANFAFQKNEDVIFTESWKRKLVFYEKWALFLCLCGVIFTTYEWWSYSYDPIINGSQIPEREVDWSTKAIAEAARDRIDKWPNVLFSFFVFIQQAALIAFIAYFVTLVIAIANHFSFEDESRTQIIPNVKSMDHYNVPRF